MPAKHNSTNCATNTNVPTTPEYRNPCGVRFDLLVPEFLEAMAKIMSVGSKKYGDRNWEKGLTGENSGINHAMAHLAAYMADAPNDYGNRSMHLAQVAVNAMFEFHFRTQRELMEKGTPLKPEKILHATKR